MTRKVILDTGPLVAFLDTRDTFHDWAVRRWAAIEPPLLGCEAMLSEACFLLRHLPPGREAVMELVRRGVIAVPFRLEPEVDLVAKLMARYSGVPMSPADACIVRMAETMSGSTVLTVDGDFRIYRMHGRRVVPTLMPERLRRS
jgi:uncharacterized protein